MMQLYTEQEEATTLQGIIDFHSKRATLVAKKEGIKHGRIEGKKLGRAETKLKIAKKLLSSNTNMSREQICYITGLSPEELDNI